jgi:hypothetical protein
MRLARPMFIVPFVVAALAACGTERPETQSAAARETDKTFKPTQYSVADFYANKEYFGASFSPDHQKVLVASNASGIWNAYAVPAAGGDLEPLTKSTTNSIFPISYFPGDGGSSTRRIRGATSSHTSTCGRLTVRSPTSRRETA